jgi:sugar lactone lactonase YvrE
MDTFTRLLFSIAFAALPLGAGAPEGRSTFNYPTGLAVDATGILYVADTTQHVIRKVAPDGSVSILAGTPGAPGSEDGTGASASFRAPRGLAVDSAGNVYVADQGNDLVRMITPAGVTVTLAGTAGSPGSADGAGAAARFDGPTGVAVDRVGNVFVADSDNGTVRRIGLDRVVTTLAGTPGTYGCQDGPGATALFVQPTGLALDAAANLIVTEACVGHVIRMISPDGTVSTLAGAPFMPGSADGQGSAAAFRYPTGVATDRAGNIFVADGGNGTLRRITPSGLVTTLAGTPGVQGDLDGTGPAARFRCPWGVAVDQAGNIFVADCVNGDVRRITPSSDVSTLAGRAGVVGASEGTGGAVRFDHPQGLAVDDAGDLFVADSGNRTVRKVTASGLSSTLAGFRGTWGSRDGMGALARFGQPAAVALEPSGSLLVADAAEDTLCRISTYGEVSLLAGRPGVQGAANGRALAATFSTPSALATDASGAIFVADTGNSVIRRITPEGIVTTLAGTPGREGAADGVGAAAAFRRPRGLALDASGNCYVADTGNSTLRRITPEGRVTTIAGLAGAQGTSDGLGSAARFVQPVGLAVDRAGDVYLADTGASTIRKITSRGLVTTLMGLPGAQGGADGIGALARFAMPLGLAMDEIGTLYVTDEAGGTIRRVRSAGTVTTMADLSGRARPKAAPKAPLAAEVHK